MSGTMETAVSLSTRLQEHRQIPNTLDRHKSSFQTGSKTGLSILVQRASKRTNVYGPYDV